MDVFAEGNHLKLSLGIFLGLVITLAVAYTGLRPLEFIRRLKDTETRLDAGVLENTLRNDPTLIPPTSSFVISYRLDKFLVCFKPVSRSYQALADRDSSGQLTVNGEYICVP